MVKTHYSKIELEELIDRTNALQQTDFQLYVKGLETVISVTESQKETAYLAEALSLRAQCYVKYNDYTPARADLKRAQGLLEQIPGHGIGPITVRIAVSFATCFAKEGNYLKARAAYLEAIEMARSCKHNRYEAVAHHNLAMITADIGDIDGAMKHFRQSLLLTRDDPNHQVACLSELARRCG